MRRSSNNSSNNSSDISANSSTDIVAADPATAMSAGLRLAVALVVAALTAALAIALITGGDAAPGLQAAVMAQLADSGVENPITAVLLNFRSFDTLLEIAVLFLVAAATLPDTSPTQPFVNSIGGTAINRHPEPVLITLVRLLVPATVLVSAYLLWIGAYAPGGAFQAGALLAGSGVLLSLTGRYQFCFSGSAARWLLIAGLSVFILAAALVALQTGLLLQYPIASAGLLILLIEATLTVSIGATLLLLYCNLTEVPPGSSPMEHGA